MKTSLLSVIALTLALAAVPHKSLAADSSTKDQAPSLAAQTAEEQKLIGVLQSNASPRDKDAACSRLKFIGTELSIPALAALLANEQLSHSARYALEPMQSPKAGSALVAALGKTSGMTRIGIINSLAYRREADAVPGLAKLVSDSDLQVATAAALALGQIGGPKALLALQNATGNTAGRVHDAVLDSLLRCATRLNDAGKHAEAMAIFKRIYDNQSGDRYRVAAYRGMIQASDAGALPYMTSAIKGKEGAAQTAALQLVRNVHAANATTTFAALLPALEPPVQIALIGGLAQRDDPSAQSAVAAMLKSQTPEVRIAALTALGTLGDASMVSQLAKFAISPNSAEQDAARLSLVQLRRGNCSETLLAQLPDAAPAVQAELARALGDRRDTNAIPRLLDLARTGADSARSAALLALGSLVDQPQLESVVVLVRDAKTPSARDQAVDTLASACRAIKSRHGKVNLDPVAQELASGPAEVRISLFAVCSTLNDPKIRAALRQGVEDTDPKVRAAAVRAMCDTTDAELAPDVLKLARESKEDNFRTLGIRASVRLATQEESAKLSNAQRLETLKALLATSLTDAQKRIVLSGLGQIQDRESLKLIEPFLDEPAVQNEAAQAAIAIAAALPCADMEPAGAALKKVIATSTDDATKKSANTTLKHVLSVTDYILAWEISGPYLEDGKDYSTLFDIPFAPENGDGNAAKWRTLGPGADPKSPWIMDLLAAVGGEQRVAYARAWIYSGQKTEARLDVGTDDGVKIWLNHQVVHANNTFRGLSPNSDQIKVTLNAGWNPLLLKVTQLTAGWAFCARVVAPDGQHLEGLKFTADQKIAAQTQNQAGVR